MFSKFNIRQRLTLQFLLLVSILFLVFSICIYFFSDLYLSNRFYNRLQERAILASSLFLDLSANQREIQNLVRGSINQPLAEEVVSIYDPSLKKFIFSTDLFKEDYHKSFIIESDTGQVINNIKRGSEKISVIKVKGYWVVISAKDVLEKEALNDLRNILIILCLVALMFISLISWFMADRALSPIATIVKQLDDIFPRNLSKRIKHSNSNDEIGTLTNTLNKLLERVEASVSSQKIFVANISHELKNPLTKIFTQIEILEMRYQDNPAFSKELSSIRSDTLELNKLTQTLLELANVYSGESEIPKADLRVDEILFSSIAEFKRWNPEANICLDLDDFPENEENLIFEVNEKALKIAFKNLIDNACKFSDNFSADIKIFEEANNLLISIYNESKPIPAEDVSKILQPFFRLDATAKGKRGHGVGLAIVNHILKLHTIEMLLEPSEKGNKFLLVFRR